MKSHTPRHLFSNARVITSLLISFVILITPVMPVVSAQVRFAGYVKSNSLTASIPGTVQPGKPGLYSPATTIVTATKTDSFPDPNNDGKAEAGDTITYDVNISNTGANDAENVIFNDTIDPNTTLVPGSLKVSPLAFADSYNATKDIALSISAPGVLANDTGTPSPTAVPIAGGATTAGGSVTLQSDGSFSYTPPAGFTGADSFTYTVTNGLTPDDTATVTINVDEGPTVTTTTPANGATNVASNTNITVNFSEPVNATTGSFSIECPTGSPQAFTLSASPAASFTLDPTSDLPAGASCTVTVIANQITDADTFDPPDQMAANYVFSFGVKLEAMDDMHSVTGNVRINTAGSGFSVLANDSPGVTISAFDSTSAQGGNVTMNTSTGTFTYDPPRGFTGTDSFNYTISNANGSDQGTVVLTVTDMIWFINNSASACAAASCGRLTSPYNSLSDFEAVNGNGTVIGGAVVDPEAGDNIFIYTGSGNYTGPLTLENNQIVIGQGATSSIETLAGITLAPDSDALPATGGTKPAITSGGNGINLAQNNSLHGLAFSNTTGTAISGTANVGTLLMSDMAINNTSGAGIELTGGGTVTSSGINDITTTTGTALNVSNTTIGAGGLTFRSISAGTAASGPVNGIVLNNTGASGGLVITGAGTADSGGIIQRTTASAILATNTQGLSLTRIKIDTPGNHGIEATNLSGNSLLANSTITAFNFATGNGIKLTNNNTNLTSFVVSASTFSNSSTGNDGILMEAQGTSNMALSVENGSTFTGLFGDGIQASTVTGASGTISVTVKNSTFNNAATNGNGGISLSLFGGPVNFTANIENNVFDTIMRPITNLGAINMTSGDLDGGGPVSDITIQNNTLNNIIGARGISFTADSFAGPSTLVINNNTIDRLSSNSKNAIIANLINNATADVTVNNNQIGQAANLWIAGTGTANAILVQTQNSASMDALLDGNIVDANTSIEAVRVRAIGSSTLNATVTGNDIADTAGTHLEFDASTGTGATAGGNICLNISGNILPGAGVGVIKLTENVAPGNINVTQASAAAVSAANSNATVTVIGTPTFGSAACTLPTAMLMPDAGNPRDYLARSSVAGPVMSALGGAEVFTNHGGSKPAQAVKKQPIDAGFFKQTKNEVRRAAGKPLNTQTANRASFSNHSRRMPALYQPAMPSGETVNATIGTLPAGKTVRVQFQVTIDTPLPSGVTQVSNQGTVSGDNFTSALTDDPSVGGSSDPTVTPILTPPDITIKDASTAEPSSGSSPAAFAVTLSHAFSQTVTVSFTTANDTGGANPATAGTDYTTTSGTLTFSPGQTVQTISVPVLADADNAETAETFLVNLSGATNGVITDGQATGTINPNGTPGTVLISELRTSGPAGADDDFVELLNNTDSDITVQASDASAGWALVKSGAGCSDTPIIVAVIPNGTVIPARGNYLLTGTAYSLGLYSTGDQTLSANIEDDRNVALFTTADLSNIQTGARLDAVGFDANTGNNCDLLREGANLQPSGGSLSEYSFVRKVDKGETLDAGDNLTDFVVVSTTPGVPVGSNTAPTLGAPGPESSTSPRGPVPCSSTGTAKFDRARLDSSQGFGSAPNLVRDTTSDPINNSTYGTLDLRRRFTNNTGGQVTRLRFRIVDMTTTPSPSGTADLRGRTSTATLVTSVNDPVTCNGSAPCNVTVEGTILETPPLQAQGGGVNSSLGAGTITLLTPLANGSSINLRFLFGVEQQGDYRIGIVIETLTSGSLGKDIWVARGNTETGGHTDGGCNTPPVANAGADQTVECAGGLTPVTLDGSLSSDPDGDTPLTYEWREGVTVLGTGATLNTSLAFGSHTITLKVTDPSGDFSEDTVVIDVVDTSNPLITAPPNVNASTGPGATSCGAFVSDATLGTASASDGCSATVTITRTGVPPGNVFPVGQTIITYTADDGHGHTSNAYQTVTVTDNTPPTLNVPANITTDAPANSCSATVDPGNATGGDNCPGVTIAGVRSDSQPLNAPYPVGVTTITWTATDAANNVTTGTQTITVNDAQAPVITLTSGTISLGPPNHQYQTFTIAQLVSSVSDLCDSSVDINDVVISQVTSDEAENANGNGDGNTEDDIVITPDCKSLQLRRERAGGGDGRVYTITVQVKDSSGNVATAVRQVFVPNSGPVINSGASYIVNGCTP